MIFFFFHRSSPAAEAGGAASGQRLIRALAAGLLLFFFLLLLVGNTNTFWADCIIITLAVDCFPAKGIMIFSDMSTGTNSPKVHPPNGTRFYTFQASSPHGPSAGLSVHQHQLLL